MRRIYLSGKHGKGKYTIVDDDIYEKIMDLDRNVSCPHGYAEISINRKARRLHREIVGEENIPKGYDVDHINDNKLDNRRENLRPCTNNENTRNRKASVYPTNKTETHSDFKGVSKRSDNCFTSTISYTDDSGMKHKELKWFDNELAAAIDYNKRSREYHGTFGRINTVPVPGTIGVEECERKYGKYIGDDNNAR